MRRLFFVFLWGLVSCWSLAGNRADVNADQNVDALDLAELSNILAGNLDVAAYDLERVVVVAPTGGDFSDPADAADWVMAQSPLPSQGYVILVTPGLYYLDRSLVVPPYTLVKGYGDNVTVLKRGAVGDDGAVVKFQGPLGYQMRVEGLYIHNIGSSSSGRIIGVLVENCRPEIFNCYIKAETTSGSNAAIGMRLDRSSELTHITIKNSTVSGVSSIDASGEAIGIELYDSFVYAYNCKFLAYQYTTGGDAYMVTLERSSETPIFYAHQSGIGGTADAGHKYYLFRHGAFGNARFYACQIDTACISNVTVGSNLKLIYCYDAACDPFP